MNKKIMLESSVLFVRKIFAIEINVIKNGIQFKNVINQTK